MSRFTPQRFKAGTLALSLSAALLSACGGGSSSGGTTPSQAGPVSVLLSPPEPGQQYWLAYQDGDSPWKVAQKTEAGYSFQVEDTGGKYAVMLVDEFSDAARQLQSSNVRGYHFTRAEVPVIDLRLSEDALKRKWVRVITSVTNTGAEADPSLCVLSLGLFHRRAPGCATGDVTSSFRSGTADAFATQLDAEGSARALVSQRGIDVAAGQRFTFDFAQATPLEPSQRVEVRGFGTVPGEGLSVEAQLLSGSRTGSYQGLAFLASRNDQTTFRYPLVPASALKPDDVYVASARTSQEEGELRHFRTASYLSRAGAAQALVLQPPVTPLSFGLTGSGSAERPTLSWNTAPGALLSRIIADPLATRERGPNRWDFMFSAGWLQGAKSVTYAPPDLPSLGGQAHWRLPRLSQADVIHEESATSKPDRAYFLFGYTNSFEDQTFWSSGVAAKAEIR